MRIAGTFLAVSLTLAASAAAGEPPAAPPTAPPTLAPASAPAADPAAASAAAAPFGAPAVAPTAPGGDLPPAASPASVAVDADAAADLAAARSASTVDSAPTRPVGLPAEAEVTIDRRNAVVAGVRFGGPTGASLRLSLLHGLGAKVREKDERVDAVCSVPIPHCAGGFLLDGEAGSGGGKLSLGVGANAKVHSEDFRGTVGAGLKLSLAHTWGSPVGTDPGLTYLGPELDLYVLRVGVNLGVLFRVAGDGGSSTLFSWGVGLRL
jgi:hypothetical protein